METPMSDGQNAGRKREQGDGRQETSLLAPGPGAVKPLISLAVARIFAKIPCISQQIAVSGLYRLF